MRRIAFFVLLASVLFLSSCTSIPLSTMLKFKDFSSENLKDIDPELFRARITHQPVFSVDADGNSLALYLSNADDSVHFEMPLEIIGTEDAKGGFWGRKKLSKTMLKMTDAGVEDFIELKRKAGTLEDEYNKMDLSIKYAGSLDKNSDPPKYLELSIELKLNGDEEFFTLIDGAKMEIEIAEETNE